MDYNEYHEQDNFERRDAWQNDPWQNDPWQNDPVRRQPVATPRRRAGGWLLGIVIVAMLVAAGAGAVRVVRTWNEALYPQETEASLSSAQTPPQTQPELPARPQSSVIPEQPAVRPQNDARLQISQAVPGVPTPSSDREGALSLQDIYTKMIPSVVSIATDRGSGTGIVMRDDGYIITNHHVIDSSSQIAVITTTDKTYPASLVGSDEASDLAVLKVEPSEPLTAAEFGDSDSLRVGDTVVAIGDPLGLELRGTMTNGIISAINRDMLVKDRQMTLIQTNAALNSGNSGGPLINCYGQGIGINTMKLSSYYAQATVEGLGFAIPISSAKPIVDELLEKGYVSGRPAIGISGEQLPAAVRAYYRLPDGVYITYVSPNSDAYYKGLSEGDIITAINDEKVSTVEELNAIKNRYAAGDVVRLTVFTRGAYVQVDITLADQALQ